MLLRAVEPIAPGAEVHPRPACITHAPPRASRTLPRGAGYLVRSL